MTKVSTSGQISSKPISSIWPDTGYGNRPDIWWTEYPVHPYFLKCIFFVIPRDISFLIFRIGRFTDVRFFVPNPSCIFFIKTVLCKCPPIQDSPPHSSLYKNNYLLIDSKRWIFLIFDFGNFTDMIFWILHCRVHYIILLLYFLVFDLGNFTNMRFLNLPPPSHP